MPNLLNLSQGGEKVFELVQKLSRGHISKIVRYSSARTFLADLSNVSPL